MCAAGLDWGSLRRTVSLTYELIREWESAQTLRCLCSFETVEGRRNMRFFALHVWAQSLKAGEGAGKAPSLYWEAK